MECNDLCKITANINMMIKLVEILETSAKC